jgi:ABC-type transporter Mla MlaB component
MFVRLGMVPVNMILTRSLCMVQKAGNQTMTDYQEDSMKTELTGVATNLSGDWTMSGISNQVPLLMAISSGIGGGIPQTNRLVVDCSGIKQIDMSGLQLLYVWVQCLQIKGLRAELVNLSDCMRSTVQKVGLHQFFGSSQETVIS